jgi:hypothetical protein
MLRESPTQEAAISRSRSLKEEPQEFRSALDRSKELESNNKWFRVKLLLLVKSNNKCNRCR